MTATDFNCLFCSSTNLRVDTEEHRKFARCTTCGARGMCQEPTHSDQYVLHLFTKPFLFTDGIAKAASFERSACLAAVDDELGVQNARRGGHDLDKIEAESRMRSLIRVRALILNTSSDKAWETWAMGRAARSLEQT